MSAAVSARISAELLERKQSIYLGRTAKGEARFGGKEDHVLALGPPRCGKTSGVIIPSVAVHPGPVIVTSTRRDVVTATMAARKAIAQLHGGLVAEVSLGGVAPRIDGVDVCGWSCTDGCGEWNTALDRANTLATTAMTGRDDPFWRDTASDLLSGCLFGAALLGEDDRTMARRIKSTDVSAYSDIIVDQCPEDHDAPFVFSGLYNTDAMADDTRRSVFATVSAQVLGQFRYETPLRSPVDLSAFARSWGTLYVIVPNERAEALRPLVTAFISAVTAIWRAEHRGEQTLLLALDEVANVAPLPTLPSIITSGSGDGIQCLLGMQEPGQASRWGELASVVIGGTTHVALFPGLRNHTYLTGIAELLGSSVQYDVQVEVRRDRPEGFRFADESQLVAERAQLEHARRSTSTRTGQLAVKREAARIVGERMRLGIRCRVVDAGGTVSNVLEEILRYTTVRLEPRRRPTIEPEVLAKGEADTMFLLTGAHGERRVMRPWFRDETWSKALVEEDQSMS